MSTSLPLPIMAGGQLPRPSVFVKCSYCTKDFTTASHKRRHEANIHGICLISKPKSKRTASAVTCEVCPKTFSNLANKKKHMKNIHGIKELSASRDRASDLTCHSCGKTFSRISSKKRHVIEIHELPRTACCKHTLVKCKECNVNFGTLRTYREHLLQAHNITTDSVNYEFASNEEFMAWKDELEMDVGVNYTAHSGAWKSADGFRMIYYCQRSGVKKTGTSKIGSFCTSTIETTTNDGSIQVTYYVNHRDHDTDISSFDRMKLPTSEKDKIAEEIKENIKDSENRQELGKKCDQKRKAREIPNNSTGELSESIPKKMKKKKAKIKAENPHEESNLHSKNEPGNNVRNQVLCETTSTVNPDLDNNSRVENPKPKSKRRKKKSHLVKSESSDKSPVVTSVQSNATIINPVQSLSSTVTDSTKSISDVTVYPGLCNSGLILNSGQVPSGIVIRPNQNSVGNVLNPGILNAGLLLIRPQLPTSGSVINSGHLHQGLHLTSPTVSSIVQVGSLGEVSTGVTLINPAVGGCSQTVNPDQPTKTLTTVAGKMPLLTTASSNSVEVNELENKILKLQQKVWKLSGTVQELQDEIAHLKDTTICRNVIEYDMHTKMECLLKPLFTKTQIKAIITDQTIYQWPDDDIIAALKLYNISRKCYRYLKDVKGFPLPSLATLKIHGKKVLSEMDVAEEMQEPKNALDENPCTLDNVPAILESNDVELSGTKGNNIHSNSSQSNILENNCSETHT